MQRGGMSSVLNKRGCCVVVCLKTLDKLKRIMCQKRLMNSHSQRAITSGASEKAEEAIIDEIDNDEAECCSEDGNGGASCCS